MPIGPTWLRSRFRDLKHKIRRVASVARTVAFLAVGCVVFGLVFSVIFTPIFVACLSVSIVAAASALLYSDSLAYALLNLVTNFLSADDDFSDFRLETFSSRALYFLATPVIGFAAALLSTSIISYVIGAKIGFTVINALDFITQPLVYLCADDATAVIEEYNDYGDDVEGTITISYEHDDPGYIPTAPIEYPPGLWFHSYSSFRQRFKQFTGIDFARIHTDIDAIPSALYLFRPEGPG